MNIKIYSFFYSTCHYLDSRLCGDCHSSVNYEVTFSLQENFRLDEGRLDVCTNVYLDIWQQFIICLQAHVKWIGFLSAIIKRVVLEEHRVGLFFGVLCVACFSCASLFLFLQKPSARPCSPTFILLSAMPYSVSLLAGPKNGVRVVLKKNGPLNARQAFCYSPLFPPCYFCKGFGGRWWLHAGLVFMCDATS